MSMQKKTLYLTIAMGVFAFLAFSLYGALVYYINAEHARSLVLLEGAIKDLAENEKLLSERALLRDIEQERELVREAFVSTEDIVDTLAKIESLAEDTGAIIEVTSVSEVVVDEKKETKAFPYGSIRLSLSVDGSWSAVFQTLALLERMPLAFWFEQVSFERASTGSLFGEESKVVNEDWQLRAVLHIAKKQNYEI